jgi:hypothetical protein
MSLNKLQYDDISRKYEELQLKSRQELEEHISEINQKFLKSTRSTVVLLLFQ